MICLVVVSAILDMSLLFQSHISSWDEDSPGVLAVYPTFQHFLLENQPFFLIYHRQEISDTKLSPSLYYYYKTWSSVSNSSLSKTFALCQFRKIKVQKLCFLPPNNVLGLEKNQSKKYFGSEENFGLEKNMSKIIWV